MTLTVAAGGSVTGSTARALLQTPGNIYGTVSAAVDNAGTLTGTGGTALSGNVTSTTNGYTSQITSFSTVTNRTKATITGTILGPVTTLTNAGNSDGGAGLALNTGGTNIYNITTVTNAATGMIRSSGGTAITSSSMALALTNAGTITGSVTATGSYNGSTIDSTAGTISGNLTLGAANDMLFARYVGSRTLATGITGTIDGGGGTNTEQVVFNADTTVTTPIDLATNFQKLALAPASKVTVTLSPAFSTSTGVTLAGSGGAVVNRGTITANGQSAVSDTFNGSPTSFTNAGTVSSTGIGTGTYAVSLYGVSQIANSGAITSSGGGISSSAYGATTANSGTITSVGTGVSGFNANVTNTGTITSTGGIGVTVGGNVGLVSSNAGTIRGQTAGVETSLYYTNTGTIGSAGTGVIVDAYGFLINAAGGVVNGGSSGAVTVGPFNAGVVNAGMINGNVTFNGFSTGGNDIYVALPGGTLNGNLALGTFATLLTDLTNPGPGQFAGITGMVTAGTGSTLRYRVASDAAAALGPVGPFTSAGYQLSNNAKLTLTAPAAMTSPLLLAGTGTVDVTAGIAVTDTGAIQSTTSIGYPGATVGTTALSIISHGALTATHSANGPYLGVATLSSGDSFTNAGTIRLTDRSLYPAAAIYGGASVTNSGTITLDGGVGITGSASVTNTGTIAQAIGGAAATGISAVSSLTNSGTISVGGVAVQLGNSYPAGPSITNTGTITSTGAVAIASAPYSYGQVTIANQTGGVITGSGRAIQVYGGTLTNAGTITGTVDLGYLSATSRSYSYSTYVAAGGTIAGDLLFGSGNDLLVQTGDALGVSGTIDGSAGINTYARSLTTTGTVAIDPAGLKNCGNALVQAVGTGTVVTTTATGTFACNLYAVGDGSVVDQAALAGTLYLGNAPYTFQSLFPGASLTAGAVTNTATVGNGVSGMATAFTNTGSVAIAANSSGLAIQIANAGSLSFTNTGTVGGGSAGYSSDPYAGASVFYGYPISPTVSLSAQDGLSISNSGSIGGYGLTAGVALTGATGPATIAFANTGTIRDTAGYSGVSLSVSGSGSNLGGAATISNSGTIAVTGAISGPLGEARQPATGAIGLALSVTGATGGFGYTLTNTGTISATGTSATQPTVGLYVGGDTGVSGTITNAAGGTISASGPQAYAVVAAGHALDLTNAGAITATGTTRSVAIATAGTFANTVRNTGTITGDVLLGGGADTVDNAGTITDAVSLGDGNDLFIQRVGGTVTGLVDGGAGTNAYRVETTGGTTTLAAGGIANFGSVTQTGTGTGTYTGAFGAPTITLSGGTLAVASGQTLSTAGATTVTGTAGAGPLTVANSGTIAGGITLADGDDTVVNTGTIRGPVQLGAGNDTYVEGVGSSAAGVDGGAGTNLYRVVLAGDRTGIGARTNFQNLAVDGTGALALTLDQSFGTVTLNGTGLTLTSGNYSVGQIVGTGTRGIQVALDRDVGTVQLGGGSDTVLSAATTLAGRYDGGAGVNTLRLTSIAPVTLAGTATNFQIVALRVGR